MAKLRCTNMGSLMHHETGLLIAGVDQQYEVLVDESMVIPNGEAGVHIKVGIVADDEERSAYLVELPRQVTMGGRRIWVPKASVLKGE